MLQWKLLKLSDPKYFGLILHLQNQHLTKVRLLSYLCILEPVSHCLVYCALL